MKLTKFELEQAQRLEQAKRRDLVKLIIRQRRDVLSLLTGLYAFLFLIMFLFFGLLVLSIYLL